jgi:hypothetical protein
MVLRTTSDVTIFVQSLAPPAPVDSPEAENAAPDRLGTRVGLE